MPACVIMSCAKCTVDLSKEVGYVKCNGCMGRYHFQCSVSSNTWKAKSQAMKDEWRCEACRKAAAVSTPSLKHGWLIPPTGDTLVNPGESSTSIVKSIQDSLQSFTANHEKKTSTLLADVEKSLQTHVKNMNNNMEKLVQSLVTKIDILGNSIKSLESNQMKLLEDNIFLKDNLKFANDKIHTLELKMSSSLSSINESTAGVSRSYREAMNRTKNSVLPNNSTATAAQSLGKVTSAKACTSDLVQASGRGGLEGGNADPHPQDQNPWQVVQPRRARNPTTTMTTRAPPKIGTKAVVSDARTSIPMVRRKDPRVRTSALFVTRFLPSVTVQDIRDLVNSSLSLSHLKISKIQSKHQDLYTSFHVEVLETDFEKIDDVMLWPDGCLLKPFRGRLLPEIVVKDDLPPSAPTGTQTQEGSELPRVTNPGDSSTNEGDESFSLNFQPNLV